MKNDIKLISPIGRDKEARDAARASLGQPAWTVGKNQKACFIILSIVIIIIIVYLFISFLL